MSEHTTETANDRFERLAAEFHAETGMLAPGKDMPVGWETEEQREERGEAWKVWRSKPASAAQARRDAAEREMRDVIGGAALAANGHRSGLSHGETSRYASALYAAIAAGEIPGVRLQEVPRG